MQMAAMCMHSCYMPEKHSTGTVIVRFVLLKRKVSLLVLRLLLYMYTKQKLQVRWGSNISTQFTACNGVKQGTILSPILFSIYMDGLFEQLEKSDVGCHMGNHYTGCIGYADYLTLLIPKNLDSRF